jgi:uncharacterized protein (DUF2252 family)
LWDVRRLALGLVIAAHVSNPNAPAIRDAVIAEQWSIARAVAEGYAEEIRALASGAARVRLIAPQANPIFADALARSENHLASREELEELTVLEAGTRKLKRGGLDPQEPGEIAVDTLDTVRTALPAVLARYRQTLLAPPPAEYFELLDVVRVFGKGIASWPRVRLLALVRGPSDASGDDIVLDAHELSDSGTAGWYRRQVRQRCTSAPTSDRVGDDAGRREQARSRSAVSASLELSLERSPIDPQMAGGLADVAPRRREHPTDVFGLDLCERPCRECGGSQ